MFLNRTCSVYPVMLMFSTPQAWIPSNTRYMSCLSLIGATSSKNPQASGKNLHICQLIF